MPEWLLGKFCGSLHTTHQPRPITCHAPSHASEQPLSGHNSLDQTFLNTPVPHPSHSYQSPPPATSPLPQLPFSSPSDQSPLPATSPLSQLPVPSPSDHTPPPATSPLPQLPLPSPSDQSPPPATTPLHQRPVPSPSYQSPPPATSPLPHPHRPVPLHLPWSVQTVSGQTWSRGQPESWRERPRQSARSHRAPCLYPTLTCTHVHSYIRRRRQPHSQHTLIRV